MYAQIWFSRKFDINKSKLTHNIKSSIFRDRWVRRSTFHNKIQFAGLFTLFYLNKVAREAIVDVGAIFVCLLKCNYKSNLIFIFSINPKEKFASITIILILIDDIMLCTKTHYIVDHNDGCDNNWVSVQVRVLLAQQFLVFMVMVCMVWLDRKKMPRSSHSAKTQK